MKLENIEITINPSETILGLCIIGYIFDNQDFINWGLSMYQAFYVKPYSENKLYNKTKII